MVAIPVLFWMTLGALGATAGVVPDGSPPDTGAARSGEAVRTARTAQQTAVDLVRIAMARDPAGQAADTAPPDEEAAAGGAENSSQTQQAGTTGRPEPDEQADQQPPQDEAAESSNAPAQTDESRDAEDDATGTPAGGDASSAESSAAFQARRNAAEKRFQTGLTPPGVKGLWCGAQLGALAGDFEGNATADDFLFFAGSLASIRLGFVQGLTDKLGFVAEMRMARTGAMFHNTTGFELGVRAAPFGPGRHGVPMTVAARIGVSALPGFLGLAWQQDAFSSQSIDEPSGLGSLRLDFRIPLVVRTERIWYLAGETAFAYDVVQREVYQSDLSVQKTTRLNLYSSELLAGVGTGWAIPGKHLGVRVEFLAGALTWPSGMGETGGTTGVALVRAGIAGLSEDDLKRAGTHEPAP